MRVPGLIYADEILMAAIRQDEALEQVANVAPCPASSASLAMPDMHEGYGFPIGGVAASDAGRRRLPGRCRLRHQLRRAAAAHRPRRRRPRRQACERLIEHLIQRDVPAGVGSEGAIATLSERTWTRSWREGAAWAVRRGYGEPEDLEHRGDGMPAGRRPARLSRRARERGAPQLGTLGSGNHFARGSGRGGGARRAGGRGVRPRDGNRDRAPPLRVAGPGLSGVRRRTGRDARGALVATASRCPTAQLAWRADLLAGGQRLPRRRCAPRPTSRGPTGRS